MSAIFVKKAPVWIVVSDVVTYYRKCHIWCKLLLVDNLLFLKTIYQLQDQNPSENNYHVIHHTGPDLELTYGRYTDFGDT